MLKSKNSNPLKILILIFFFPLFVSALIVVNIEKINIRTNPKGQLLRPPVLLDSNNIEKEIWNLVYIQDEICDNKCIKDKEELTAVHKLLGPRQESVKFLTMKTNTIIDDINPGNTIIVDPNGYYIMKYTKDINKRDILSDMKKLLKYSHV